MPYAGLEKLEILRIQNTQTLKTVPSVYSFEVSHGNLYYATMHQLKRNGIKVEIVSLLCA